MKSFSEIPEEVRTRKVVVLGLVFLRGCIQTENKIVWIANSGSRRITTSLWGGVELTTRKLTTGLGPTLGFRKDLQAVC